MTTEPQTTHWLRLYMPEEHVGCGKTPRCSIAKYKVGDR